MSTFSPSRSSHESSRFHQFGLVGSASRLRSSTLRKPPESLRRAVADCLSSSSGAASSYHGSPATVLNEASRTLRDYLAAPSTTDLSYNVILEHTIAERERSPAVVARCVTLLKRYLLRYKPCEETLLQIDRFCMSIVTECEGNLNRRSSPWSQSLNQQSIALTSSSNSSPSLPVSSFASGALVKSLNYVRSLVAQHIPRRSFQSAAFTGPSSTSRQSLPSLSSLLSRSFNSQLSPASVGESTEKKDSNTLPASNLSNISEADSSGDHNYIAMDLLNWRWVGEHQQSILSTESDRILDLQCVRPRNFLELGAAALLVGDMESKMKGQPWKYFGTADMPYLDQLLQPSSVTTIINSASAHSHLRSITASKRNKSGSHQIWEDTPVSTFRPRARQLFQYRHYSEQQPLRLNPAEISEVITAVSSETYSTTPNYLTMSSRLSNSSRKQPIDVAVSVLIKLIIDMYVLDSGTAAPLTLSMLEGMLSSPKPACRVRAFDLILNLGVHAHLLEPLMTDDTSTIEEEYPGEMVFENEDQLATKGKRKVDSDSKLDPMSAIDTFESWILNILYEILLLLVQTEEKEESVWAAALSCLLYFACDRGKILRKRLEGLDIRVVKLLIHVSRTNSWAEEVHRKLICMLVNMLYQVPDGPTKASVFLLDQVDLIGGIEFICYEYALANLREEKRNLYLVLFDYVLHRINDACKASGVSEYDDEEIQPLATLLALADAPEAFYISVRLGVEGIGELLRRSISAKLSMYSNNQRLIPLLENITEKFDAIIDSFTHLDQEFSHQMLVTKSCKFLEDMENAAQRDDVVWKAKFSWATLHSLLHSDRIAYRQNGYTWLGDLLIAEISEGMNTDIWSKLEDLHQKITYAGIHDASVASDIPLSIWLLCGLLKSKDSVIRCGFLFILERLLMRCKFLLDENEMQHSTGIYASDDNLHGQLKKANAIIDIMSSALSLVFQINETDRINILKMCDILFSQLCLKVCLTTATPCGEFGHHSNENKNIDSGEDASELKSQRNEFLEETDNRSGYHVNGSLMCETASMAAMLLRGQAVIPMQLVARVPAALFYWPLIQLAGAATDNISLGVAATLLLLLIGKCTADPSAFQEVGGEEFFRELLDDTDSRVAYYSSAFLLKRMMTDNPDDYQHMLQNLVLKAQQSNNEKLLENPYLQMRGILQLSNYGL
ncbi:hypothetical protein K2173_012829 [Erythroxylum novogranatense]|uniref:ARM repeat superfamily protein n=1 Tax=Erythroxylum novogranatense TaxID=1862640 RepID=A0AAV8S5I8_9ROSI|nr:hypothetical protein K2173_012829 [Erythroxylum novogranatense]